MKKVPWMCLTDYWKSQKKNYPTRKNKIKRLKKKKKNRASMTCRTILNNLTCE